MNIEEIYDKPGCQWTKKEQKYVCQYLETKRRQELLLNTLHWLGCIAIYEDAEDILHEFYEKSLDSVIKSYDPDKGKRFWGYLFTCLQRFCRRERKKIKIRTDVIGPIAPDIIININDNAYNRLVSRSEVRTIEQCLGKLSLHFFEVIEMHCFHDKSIAEIAKKVGISESNVKVRLFRARQKLGVLLNENGISMDNHI